MSTYKEIVRMEGECLPCKYCGKAPKVYAGASFPTVSISCSCFNLQKVSHRYGEDAVKAWNEMQKDARAVVRIVLNNGEYRDVIRESNEEALRFFKEVVHAPNGILTDYHYTPKLAIANIELHLPNAGDMGVTIL